jgi:hypothetical protein
VAVSSGVYSLIGVAVGGGITWATQWQVAARADRLDARVARRRVARVAEQTLQRIDDALERLK